MPRKALGGSGPGLSRLPVLPGLRHRHYSLTWCAPRGATLSESLFHEDMGLQLHLCDGSPPGQVSPGPGSGDPLGKWGGHKPTEELSDSLRPGLAVGEEGAGLGGPETQTWRVRPRSRGTTARLSAPAAGSPAADQAPQEGQPRSTPGLTRLAQPGAAFPLGPCPWLCRAATEFVDEAFTVPPAQQAERCSSRTATAPRGCSRGSLWGAQTLGVAWGPEPPQERAP